jgi:SAM-dependent methyltransferase
MAHQNAPQPPTPSTPASFDWTGRSGEVWRDNQSRLDRMLAPYGAAAIAAASPAPGERVLDVGCGSGATSLELAARVSPSGSVLGLDISETLLSRARERVPDGASVSFVLGDASKHALPDHAFDLLFSRFGVMFFDDPTAAFTHLRRALTPTGRVTFVCWRPFDQNDWVRLPMQAVADILPPLPLPGPNAPGPFAFGDAALELALQVGPLARALADQPPELRDRAATAVRAAFATRATDHVVTMDGAAWVVTARNTTSA